MRPLSTLLVLFLSIPVLSSPARAELYVVDPYGTGDFPTIQAAVNDLVDGDVIALTDGTFEGEGNRGIYFWNKSIKILSVSETRAARSSTAEESTERLASEGPMSRAFHSSGSRS